MNQTQIQNRYDAMIMIADYRMRIDQAQNTIRRTMISATPDYNLIIEQGQSIEQDFNAITRLEDITSTINQEVVI